MLNYEDRLHACLHNAFEEAGRHFERRSDVHKTLRRVAKRFDNLGVPYAVVGAMAMFAHGFRRFTVDVDIPVAAEAMEKIGRELDDAGYPRDPSKPRSRRDPETG